MACEVGDWACDGVFCCPLFDGNKRLDIFTPLIYYSFHTTSNLFKASTIGAGLSLSYEINDRKMELFPSKLLLLLPQCACVGHPSYHSIVVGRRISFMHSGFTIHNNSNAVFFLNIDFMFSSLQDVGYRFPKSYESRTEEAPPWKTSPRSRR